MPRKLICSGPGTLQWQQYTDSPVPPGHIRIRSEHSAAKHGTEMASFKGYANARGGMDAKLQIYLPSDGSSRYPSMVGNMVVGEVTEVGQRVEAFSPGDRALTYACFGESHTVDGTEYCWRVPDGVDWRSAVCLDPAFFALAAIRDGGVRVGDVVVILGLGAIGLMAVQLAAIAGAGRVYAVDPLEIRRAAAVKLGADVVLDPTTSDVGLRVRKDTGGRGADVAIEYSGSRQAMQDALRAIALGGNVVAGAYPPAYDAGLDFGAEAHHNTPNILFSRGCTEPNREHPRWDKKRLYDACWDLIVSGRLAGEHVVYPVVAFDDLMEQYPTIASAPETNIKLGVVHGSGKAQE